MNDNKNDIACHNGVDHAEGKYLGIIPHDVGETTVKAKYFGLSSIFRFGILLTTFGCIILAILLIKYFTLSNQNIWLLTYSVFVITFVMTRISTSFFYSNKKKWQDKSYEPTVSFVIPVKNEEAVIASTISKCFAVNYPKEKIEVLVINDGSTDKTLLEMERMKKIYPALTIIDFKVNHGKRHAMAEGFKIAKGEIIVQMDSDSCIEKNSLRILVAPFQDQNVGAACAHTDVQNANENFLTRMQQAYYFISFRAMKAYESMLDTVLCCSGCCSAYRKSIAVPLLQAWRDEKFLSKPVSFGDDRSLTILILKTGCKTVYISDAKAFTIAPNNLKQFTKQQVRWKKSWIINAIKMSGFIIKKDKFVAMTYFFPLIIISMLTPFIGLYVLFYTSIMYSTLPVFYVAGVFLISCLLAIYYKFYNSDENWKYIFVWVFMGMIYTTYLMFYAILDIRNMKWGTR
jgi:hyaluronan synthase